MCGNEGSEDLKTDLDSREAMKIFLRFEKYDLDDLKYGQKFARDPLVFFLRSSISTFQSVGINVYHLRL